MSKRIALRIAGFCLIVATIVGVSLFRTPKTPEQVAARVEKEKLAAWAEQAKTSKMRGVIAGAAGLPKLTAAEESKLDELQKSMKVNIEADEAIIKKSEMKAHRSAIEKDRVEKLKATVAEEKSWIEHDPRKSYKPPSPSDLILETVLIMAVSLIGIVVYFAPGITASRRKHHQSNAIWVLNFALGWTLIGWVIALVWANTVHEPSQVIVMQPTIPSDPEPQPRVN